MTFLGPIQLRFNISENAVDTHDDFGIDNVVIGELPTCFYPSNITLVKNTSTSVFIGWEENADAPEWEIEYGLENFNLGTGSTIVTTSNTNNLIVNTI